VDADAFVVYGVLGDGSRTPPLELGSLFDSYHNAISAADEDSEIDLAAAQADFERAHLENMTEKMRRGMPVR
jgi:hypothetical protein